MSRYLTLFASFVVHTCLGGVYAWSVFVPALTGNYQLSLSQTQVIFSLSSMTFALATVLAGWLQGQIGARLLTLLGCFFFSVAYLLASLTAGNFSLLLLSMGFLGGLGIGLAYLAPITVCMQLFPRRKGLVTGLTVAGFGLGAIILSNIAQLLLERGLDVLTIFSKVGLYYGLISLFFAFFIGHFKKEGKEKNETSFNWSTVFARPVVLWLLPLCMFSAALAGLLIIAALKPLGLTLGLEARIATYLISAFAAGNAFGRIIWGFIFDSFKERSIFLSLTLLAVAIFSLLFVEQQYFLLLAVFFIGFGFGSSFVIYAALLAELFGSQALRVIYPYILVLTGAAGFLGPLIGGFIFDRYQSFNPAIVLAAVSAGLMAVIAFTFAKKLKPAIS